MYTAISGRISVIKNAATKNRSGTVMNGKMLIVYSSFIIYTFKTSDRERFVNLKKLEKSDIGV